jgi:protein-tyrosine phosphatase
VAGDVTRVAFVCLGNICRSPMAEVVMRALVRDAGLDDEIEVESAGTGDWHVGGGADERALATLRQHGYGGSAHRARQFTAEWFDRVDVVVAMDRANLTALRRLAPADRRDSIRLLMSYADDAAEQDVPDPYYGGEDGFVEVLTLIRRGCAGLLDEIRPGRS